MRIHALLLVLVAGAVLISVARAEETSPSAKAQAFLGSLKAEQRRQVVQPFESADRRNWHYVPRARRGLPVGRMNQDQRTKAMALLRAVVGEQGQGRAREVFALEGVLQGALPPSSRRRDPSWRDPGLYQVALFGAPNPKSRWGLRVEGHHLSVNVVVVGDRVVSSTPLFFGASPAEVRRGQRGSLRPLGGEEDLARALVLGMDESTRRAAIASTRAPGDIRLGPYRKAALTGKGASLASMPKATQAAFFELVEVWMRKADPTFAASARDALRKADARRVRFSWEGSTRKGQPHAYTIESPTAIFEYVNRGNHVHTVWRDPRGDFGATATAPRR